jgi:hypothetical protein
MLAVVGGASADGDAVPDGDLLGADEHVLGEESQDALTLATYGPAGSKTIYVGVGDRSTSLYRSTDGGNTWQAVSGQPTGQMPQHGVLCPPGGRPARVQAAGGAVAVGPGRGAWRSAVRLRRALWGSGTF